MNRALRLLLVLLAIAGLSDALYLAYEHFSGSIPPCNVGIFSDCGAVLQSPYALIFGIPLAVLGAIHYFILTTSLIGAYLTKDKKFQVAAVFFATVGFISSLYFAYLQLVPIGALCLYCMVSALISILIFFITQLTYRQGRVYLVGMIVHILYKKIGKHILFMFDPEQVHEAMTKFGFILGTNVVSRKITQFLFYDDEKLLHQNINNIHFKNPVGLAAGFDYEANLPWILPSLGFGFGTIGTITNSAYEGNERPMLGRLPKSLSLMVNKGFKNLGAKKTIAKLKAIQKIHAFDYPVGISIGRTNTLSLRTQKQSIDDIANAFTIFEKSKLPHMYYELNISCPNLKGSITFYPPKNLEDLLKRVDKLNLSKPVFVKMPIEKSNKEILSMLQVISTHSPVGVIFGNLQKDRTNTTLVKEEVEKFPVGNFSGKPCFDRSNELITLTYKKYKKRFIIIGCGGVFSAHDAYEKIKRGASLVQLITGMIYEGPQRISQVNQGLVELLKRDGYASISEAIGTYYSYSK